MIKQKWVLEFPEVPLHEEISAASLETLKKSAGLFGGLHIRCIEDVGHGDIYVIRPRDHSISIVHGDVARTPGAAAFGLSACVDNWLAYIFECRAFPVIRAKHGPPIFGTVTFFDGRTVLLGSLPPEWPDCEGKLAIG